MSLESSNIKRGRSVYHPNVGQIVVAKEGGMIAVSGSLTFPSHVSARALIRAPILRQRVDACVRETLCMARFRVRYTPENVSSFTLYERLRIFTRLLRFVSSVTILDATFSRIFMPVRIAKRTSLRERVASRDMKLRGSQSGAESWLSTLSCRFCRSIFYFLLQTAAVFDDVIYEVIALFRVSHDVRGIYFFNLRRLNVERARFVGFFSRSLTC